jgi:MSHA biogenesis protein MshM
MLDTGDMRQLKERITHGFRLDPLRRQDVESYIEFRMRAAGYRGPSVFTRPALELIAQASQGLTRRVNILADKALLAAFAGGSHAVTPREVRRAIGDSNFYRPARRLGRAAAIGAGLAAALALGWTLHALLAVPPVTPAPAAPTAAVASRQTADPAPATPATPTTAAGETREKPSSPADNPKVTESAKLPVTAYQEAERPAVPAAAGALWQDRLAATQRVLDGAPGDRQAIQLFTVEARDVGNLENFLLKASKLVSTEDLLVYSVKFGGKQHYRVAYGNYSDANEALAAVQALPPLLKAQGPYPRSFERMRSQNRQ